MSRGFATNTPGQNIPHSSPVNLSTPPEISPRILVRCPKLPQKLQRVDAGLPVRSSPPSLEPALSAAAKSQPISLQNPQPLHRACTAPNRTDQRHRLYPHAPDKKGQSEVSDASPGHFAEACPPSQIDKGDSV